MAKQPFTKQALSLPAQIALLRERGMLIQDEPFALHTPEAAAASATHPTHPAPARHGLSLRLADPPHLAHLSPPYLYLLTLYPA